MKLKSLVKSVQEKLNDLKAFDPTECVEQHCERLELQVIEATESAWKHIYEIEKGLQKRIQEFRQRCLDALDC